MTRVMRPFRRADGLYELAILGNFGLAHAYNKSEKVTHFVEDEDVDDVNSESYYIQLDGGFTLPEYKSEGVHLIRNIEIGDETAAYETFCPSRDRDDQEDWMELTCPASDFPYLFDCNELIPMKKAAQ